MMMAPALETEDVRDFARSWAVVMGVQSYRNGVPSLVTPLNDACRLADIIHEDFGYELLFDPRSEAEITSTTMRDLLTKTLPAKVGQSGDRERLLFYFAGHGVA